MPQANLPTTTDDTNPRWLNEHAARLDRALQAQLPEYSRAKLQQIINDGAVRVDGRVWRHPGRRLRGGEWLSARLPPPPAPLAAQPLPLRWYYEDAQLAVLEKPAGLVVQPGAGQREGTLVNALLAHWPELRGVVVDPQRAGTLQPQDARAGIVHRLDKETSGLLVVARKAAAQTALQAQFAARTVEKRYIALVEKTPPQASGVIDTPLSRDPQQRHRFRVARTGKRAISHYRVLLDAVRGGRALLEIRPETGRTHQIRAQLSFLGCPVVGDRVYGYRKQRLALPRHFLHASGLRFTHPTTAERLHFDSPLPPELADLLRKLGVDAEVPREW